MYYDYKDDDTEIMNVKMWCIAMMMEVMRNNDNAVVIITVTEFNHAVCGISLDIYFI